MTIDFYDDLGEAYLLATGGEETEHLKTAEWREPFDLLDRDFALILVDGEAKEHRKFACFDAGNVAMSMWYLTQAVDRLPPAAVKIAAINLAVAAGDLGLDIPEEIFAMNVSVDPEWANDILDEKRVKIAMPMPGQVGTPMANKGMTKQPMSPGMMGGAAGVSMTGAASPTRTPPMTGAKTPMAGGGRTAMGGQAMPMGKTAEATSPFDVLRYATENWDDMDPYDRHDTAVFLTKSASAGVLVPDHIYKYGGVALNPIFSSLMEARKRYSVQEQDQDNYDRLGKMASAMDLEDVVEALYLMDEQASLTPRYGTNIPDPLLCVYGQVKEAEWSWNHGGDMVNEAQLKRYAAATGCQTSLGELFTDDICAKFKKDPLGTFKSMPLEQQIITSRLATQSRHKNDGGYFA